MNRYSQIASTAQMVARIIAAGLGPCKMLRVGSWHILWGNSHPVREQTW